MAKDQANALKRVEMVYFRDLDGKCVAAGDRVAAASRNYAGIRIGEVLKITGVYVDGVGYRGIRVKIRVDKAGNSSAGQKYNPETERWEFKPFTMTYDGDSVVRLGG